MRRRGLDGRHEPRRQFVAATVVLLGIDGVGLLRGFRAGAHRRAPCDRNLAHRQGLRRAFVFASSLAVAIAVVSSAYANDVVPLNFVPNGPAGISTSHANGPRAGAINSLAVDPLDGAHVWVGSVNGGVWRTTSARSTSPIWKPLTDQAPSLSVGALALDPTDPTAKVLVAAIGKTSSTGSVGPLTGVLRTTDGGDHWTSLGSTELSSQNISGVASRGADTVVTSQTGVWRRDASGPVFSHEGMAEGIVAGKATDLVGDPADPSVLYAALVGPGGGIYRSTNSGANWARISTADFAQSSGTDLVSNARKIVLSVHHAGTHDVVYAGIVDATTHNPSGVFRTTHPAAASPAWTRLDVPAIEHAAQGRMALLADPADPNVSYIGGDETPGGKGEGPIFRCDASKPHTKQCRSLVGPMDNHGNGTADDSAPHADSRRMAFDGNDLFETDDGGIFRRTRPHQNTGHWRSLDGNLAITEAHSCGYDHVRRVVICGTQDNGTVRQPSHGATGWDEIGKFDGGKVAVSDATPVSRTYFSSQKLRQFSVERCDGTNPCTTQKPTLTLASGAKLSATSDTTLTGYVRIAAGVTNSHHVVIATGHAYESSDGANTLKRLVGLTGVAKTIAYGTTGKPNILYIGTPDGVFRHTVQFAAMHKLGGYPGGAPTDIAVDPANWQSAWVIDSTSVWHTTDGGLTWTAVTTDLGAGGAGAADLRTVAFVPSSPALVLVGASDGLYATDATQLGPWYKLGGTLPNATVVDLDYDPVDHVLVVSSLGRSTWTLAHADTIKLPALPTITQGPRLTAARFVGHPLHRTRRSQPHAQRIPRRVEVRHHPRSY